MYRQFRSVTGPSKIYNGFAFTSIDDNRAVNEILDKFDQFVTGEINETMNVTSSTSLCGRDGRTICGPQCVIVIR